jgi:maltose-binding protein MalE
VWSGIEYATVDAIRDEFEDQTKHQITIREFDINNIRSELLLAYQSKTSIPDVLWVPSDFLGMYQAFQFAKIPEDWIDGSTIESKALQLVTVDEAIRGIPLALGNHLVLYVNPSLTSKHHPSWEELIAAAENQSTQIAMQHPNTYFFRAFISLFEDGEQIDASHIASEDLFKGISFYEGLTKNGVIEPFCNQDCARKKFVDGEVPYLIDGDWALAELREGFGESIVISQLPTYQGNIMHSLSGGKVLVFTEQAFANPDKRAVLKIFSEIVQNQDFVREVIIEKNLISAHHKLNRDPLVTSSKYYADLYKQLQYAQNMPSSLRMAVVWDALDRGLKRYRTGMPADKAAQYTVDFIERETARIERSMQASVE